MTTSKIVTLRLSEEQELAVKAFFAHYDWDWDAMVIREDVCHDTDNRRDQDTTSSDDREVDVRSVQNATSSLPEHRVCSYCFCTPCIADSTRRQQWWPVNPRHATPGNNKSRKDCYRRFWAMMSNLGVWRCPEYLARKRTAREKDPKQRKFVYHRREMMPNCVLQLVRHWYPNQEGKPYMGHLWE